MSDMDAVNSFNAELQSLYDVKPPISKGKMTSITRAALKAVKLYKHVVQSVEKFIQKCKAEYKIPGLYVIDSIIRQSRHQFGPEKDVFAPRFSRNIQTTFVHLYRCPEEDKAKIIRVLNLWQKNRIFSPQVIQPLFDLADPQNPIWEQINQNSNTELGGGGASNSNNLNNFSSGGGGVLASGGSSNPSSGFPSLPAVHFNKKVLDYDYGDGDDDNMMGGGGGGSGKPSDSASSNPNNATSNSGGNNNSGGPLDALGSILSNPEILRQLQTLQEQMAQAAAAASYAAASTPEQERQRKLAELSKQEAAFDQRLAETVARLPFAKDCELPLPPDGEGSHGDGVDQNSNQLGSSTGAAPSNPNVLLPPPFFQQLADQQNQHHHQQQQQQQQQQSQQQQLQNLFRNINAAGGSQAANPFGLQMPFPIPQGVPPPFPQQHQDSSASSVPHNLFSGGQDNAFFNHLNNTTSTAANNQHHHPQISISQTIYEEIDLCEEEAKDDGAAPPQRSSSDRDRGDRLGRSKRSRSHDRHDSGRRGSRRSTSRSRDRSGRSKRGYRSRSRERAREEREKEKERQRKGFPPVKREHLSICSTTLWVGHLSKLVNQEEISDTFGAYGDIISIDLIHPRGCAFIVMNRRQDAARALDRLKNTKLQGKAITLAWAPGKGVKGKEWKDYWEVTDGVSYIPWSKLRDETNLEEFEDGGCMDEDTLPEFLKNKPQPPSDSKSQDSKALMPPLPPMDNENSQDSNSISAIPPPQPPLPPPATAAQMMSSLVPGLAGMTGGGPPPPPSGIPSLLDHAALAAAMSGQKPGDTDARDGQPQMAHGPFGMGPPGMGMMPMGMNLMVPPPMLAAAMGQGNPFQGMAGLPGMPPMMGIPGMVPAPQLQVHQGGGPPPGHPHHLGGGTGAPGLLGEVPQQPSTGIPPPQQLNDSLLNSSNEESAMSASDLMGIPLMEESVVGGSKRGKKRSRFDDPEEKMSPSGENSMDQGNMSPSQDPTRGLMKDDRPVFERLKSLAEGYSFANSDKAGAAIGGSSLLGTPPGIGGGPRPLMPNSFSQPPGLLGTRPPVRPLFGTPVTSAAPSAARHQTPSTWAGGFGENTENPFLNPNPSNPFATASSGGNPFVAATSFAVGSENPFEIVANSQQGNPFATQGAFGGGGRRGGWRSGGDEWGGGGGRGGRGGRGRGGWRGSRASGGWGSNDQMDDLINEGDESRASGGGFRGGRGGRGGRDNSWGRGRDGDRSDRGDRPRSREGDRASSGGRRRSRSPSSQRSRGGDEDRGNRRRRNSSENNSERRSRHRSGGDDRRESRHGGRRDRDRGSSSWQQNQDSTPSHRHQHNQAQKETNWENWETADTEAPKNEGWGSWEPVVQTSAPDGEQAAEQSELAVAETGQSSNTWGEDDGPPGDNWENDDGPPGEEPPTVNERADAQQEDDQLMASNTQETEQWNNEDTHENAIEQQEEEEGVQHHPHREEHFHGGGSDIQEDTNNEDDYPAQEQEYGDYPTQEEENNYNEEEENQHHHDKTGGGDEYTGFNNEEEEFDQGGEQQEVYDNGEDDGRGEAYEENDYSNYNNEDEEELGNEENEFGDGESGCDGGGGGGEYFDERREDYQCDRNNDDQVDEGDDGDSVTMNDVVQQEPDSCSSFVDSGNVKCTSSFNNSEQISEAAPSEELNSISS